jgi:hypothetical protein
MEKDNLKNETTNSTNTVLCTGGEIGFNCEICGNVQSVGLISSKQIFPLCNNCKKDLYEIIKDRRTPPTCA